MERLVYRHVDVFSRTPLSGNGLTVFWGYANLNTETMQKITQEMRQFESVFIFPTSVPNQFSARIFTLEEELGFAGHPILGAACTLHERTGNQAIEHEWKFQLLNKQVSVKTIYKGSYYLATMEQGEPIFEQPLSRSESLQFLESFNLTEHDIYYDLPLQVVSTGLPYLIIPLRKGIEKAKIITSDLERMLSGYGAKFCYLLDVSNLEGRTWDNLGSMEDIATGSAAGPVGAYLVKQNIVQLHTDITLSQGRFLNRPSKIFISVSGAQESINSIKVSGEVCMVASGAFDIFPGLKGG